MNPLKFPILTEKTLRLPTREAAWMLSGMEKHPYGLLLLDKKMHVAMGISVVQTVTTIEWAQLNKWYLLINLKDGRNWIITLKKHWRT